jgi:predicted GH43/DUF377 family glycosyl hydrolase
LGRVNPCRPWPSAPDLDSGVYFWIESILTEIESLPPLVERQAVYLRPNAARVIIRQFKPATEPRDHNPTDKTRANHIVDRVMALDPETSAHQLAEVLENFQDRHRDLPEICEERAGDMELVFDEHTAFTKIQRRLVGAYFLQEYSYEASALFNPSIVPHPDQSGAPAGGLRFILSLRAVGEGHVSSLTFRTGTVTVHGTVSLDPASKLAGVPIASARGWGPDRDRVDVSFNPAQDISERVIFPVTEAQSNGIEDARFVAFEDEGRTTYYATYTAYSGFAIRSELLETRDFVSFRMTPLTGKAARNKGMALFPRRIGGKFAVIGRQDNECLYFLTSADLHVWEEGVAILKPEFPWEFVQMGNCGPPIELDEGWLLLTHGVGALRKYCIGVALLDKADPTKVLARSVEPIIRPDPLEREGYVPNVVYTCGAMRHGDRIILPYAVSDTFSTFATISIAALMTSLGV